ncbi:hypothetical protein D4764_15G0008900 [Takifugu flavidus]|uniref:HTH CENPB-type domain-containing protein n=1 Tax=Takifugu flavidus TaxID=433684 RepID=A0A5C6P317_9TELE|nr:hypothetical protein D4764_15G0008900 [Takifugu flavidus]
MDIEHFQGGPSWCFRFMRRQHLSIRARTTVAQRLPADYQERVAIFRTYCRDKITAPSHIYEAAIQIMAVHRFTAEMVVEMRQKGLDQEDEDGIGPDSEKSQMMIMNQPMCLGVKLELWVCLS